MNSSNEISCQVQRVSILNLNKLIQPVSSNDPVLKKIKTDQLVVAYDRKKERAHYYNPGIISSLLGTASSIELYFVDTYEELAIIQKCKLNSTLYKPLDIEVKLNISVIKGVEIQLVEALARRDTPARLLADMLFKWLANELSASADLAFEDPARFKEKIRTAIADEARKIGLKITSTVNYPNYPNPGGGRNNSVDILEKQAKVQPSQFNGFVNIDFELRLIPDHSAAFNINMTMTPADRDEWRLLLKHMMQSYIRTHVGYNELINNLNNAVRTGLIQYWNNQLQQLKKGWKVADLKLTSYENLPVQFKHDMLKIVVLLNNAEVHLSNSVILYLENAQLFKNSAITNLDAWITGRLQKASQKILSNILYSEFVSKFHYYSEEIKKELEKDVTSIGYKVELLLTSAPVGPEKLQIDFQLNEEEQLFETILNDKIRLNTIVSGKILSLNHETWNKTLTPDTNLTKEIKTEILREIRNTILKVTPENFYAKFGSEVPEELKTKIKSVLINKYNLSPDVDVHLKIEHSQLKERLEQLKRGSLYTKASLFNGAARYTVKFCILGVPADKWELFASKKYADIEEEQNSIKEDITIIVEKKLNQVVTEKYAGNKLLVNLVEKFANESVADIQTNRFLDIYIEKVTEDTNELREVTVGGNLQDIREMIIGLQTRRKQIRIEIEDFRKSEHPKRVRELEEELLQIENTLNPVNHYDELDQMTKGLNNSSNTKADSPATEK